MTPMRRKQIRVAAFVVVSAVASRFGSAQTPVAAVATQPAEFVQRVEVTQPPQTPSPQTPSPQTPLPKAPLPQPPTAPGRAPTAQPGPPPPQPGPGQGVNVRVELTITDEGTAAAPVKKVVSMTVADREFGRIRSTAFVGAIGEVPLNVDARPMIQPDGRLRLQLTINYDSIDVQARETNNPRKIMIREELGGIIIESGKALVVTQSADPVGDRKVMIEVKATILR